MPDTRVSMKELRDTLERFIQEIEGAEVIRLDNQGAEAGSMPQNDLTDALDALKKASQAASEICQQPVLAILARKP